jgi:hypothetical protein
MEIDVSLVKSDVRSIIATHFPEELLAYDIGADIAIDELLVVGQPTKADHAVLYEFGVSADEVLSFVKVLTAIFTLLKNVDSWWRNRQSVDKEHASTALATQLKSQGISEDKANDISSQFAEKFVGMIEHQSA